MGGGGTELIKLVEVPTHVQVELHAVGNVVDGTEVLVDSEKQDNL